MPVPANSFAEYVPEPTRETKKKDVVWFALSDERPLTAFAGIWTGALLLFRCSKRLLRKN